MKYGFTFKCEPLDAADLEVGYGTREQWFQSKGARDNFARAYKAKHPSTELRLVERPDGQD